METVRLDETFNARGTFSLIDAYDVDSTPLQTLGGGGKRGRFLLARRAPGGENVDEQRPTVRTQGNGRSIERTDDDVTERSSDLRRGCRVTQT